MKKIHLNRDFYTLVDDEDYDNIKDFTLFLTSSKSKNTIKYYVAFKLNQKNMYLHRFLMNAIKGQTVDHIDSDGLNNQKNNLRLCSQSENIKNRKKMIKGTSKYKGVYLHTHAKRWVARIKINRKTTHLGIFDKEIDAAKAYNNAATLHFGEYAKLNDLGDMK